MIDHIFLDVDGVIVGTMQGKNFPYPNYKVTQVLKEVNKMTPISLISAKSLYTFEQIIKRANLTNIHSGDNGAVVGNSREGRGLRTMSIETDIVKEVLNIGLNSDIYTEIYTDNSYYIQANQESQITGDTAKIRDTSPRIVGKLKEVYEFEEIVKVTLIFKNDDDSQVDEIIKYFSDRVNLKKSYNQKYPYTFLIITAKGVSKKNAIFEISELGDINLKNALAVGDSPQDWDFIEECGYKATLENAKDELKEKINNSANGFISSSVDEDGIIDIFKHFKLI